MAKSHIDMAADKPKNTYLLFTTTSHLTAVEPEIKDGDEKTAHTQHRDLFSIFLN